MEPTPKQNVCCGAIAVGKVGSIEGKPHPLKMDVPKAHAPSMGAPASAKGGTYSATNENDKRTGSKSITRNKGRK